MRALLTLWLTLTGCPKAPVSGTLADGPAVAGVVDPGLRALLAAHWDATMAASPEWATAIGDHRFDDQVSDRSVEGAARRRAEVQAFLARASALRLTAPGPRDALFLTMLVGELQAEVAREACHVETWMLSPRMHPVADLFDVLLVQPLATPADLEVMERRVQAWAASLDGHIAALRAGVAAGRVANRTSLQLILEQVDALLADEVTGWPPVIGWADADGPQRTPGVVAGAAALLDRVARPATARWRAVVADELLPVARSDDAPGLATLPGGEACYAALVRQYTTLPLSAEEVHATGLAELERIHQETVEVGARAFGLWDRARIYARLREDPSLSFGSREEILATAEAALRRAEAAVPAAFGRLPQTPCVVSEIPAFEAPYTTIAYYRQPVPGGGKPGEYFVNTYAPETRPRHEAEVLAFHESVPGHHLQIALSYELDAVPAFLKYGGSTVFVEGWALYTERLADELGLYSSDVDRLGMLAFDAWRASRLVVDTGLHDLGWSREQAVQFMLANTSLRENNIRNEVDRYVTWPGQALAYKTGQLEIRRLRADAEARLGTRFDLRAFHDALLGAGAVSLPVLREQVEAFVAARSAAP